MGITLERLFLQMFLTLLKLYDGRRDPSAYQLTVRTHAVLQPGAWSAGEASCDGAAPSAVVAHRAARARRVADRAAAAAAYLSLLGDLSCVSVRCEPETWCKVQYVSSAALGGVGTMNRQYAPLEVSALIRPVAGIQQCGQKEKIPNRSCRNFQKLAEKHATARMTKTTNLKRTTGRGWADILWCQ